MFRVDLSALIMRKFSSNATDLIKARLAPHSEEQWAKGSKEREIQIFCYGIKRTENSNNQIYEADFKEKVS